VYWTLNLAVAEKHFNDNGNKDSQNWIRRSYRDYKAYNDRICQAYQQTEEAIQFFERRDQPYSAGDVRDYVEQGGRLDKLLPYFVQHCRQRRLDAENDLSKLTTVTGYEFTLKVLRWYLRETYQEPDSMSDEQLDQKYWPLAKFDKRAVLELKAWMEKSYSVNSTTSYLRNLRHVLYQAADAGLVSLEQFPMRGVNLKITRKKVERLHDEEINQLATSPAPKKYRGGHPSVTNPIHARPLAMMMYLAHGARIGDAISWRVSNYVVEGEEHRLRYTTGKNKKPLSVLLDQEARQLLAPYLVGEDGQPKKSTEFLFPYLPVGFDQLTVQERFIHVRRAKIRARKQIASLAERIGISKRVTPHVMRHSFADMLRRAGVDLETAQMTLGHSDIRTTRDYQEQFDQQAVDSVSLLYQNRRKDD
jgi:integrase